MRQTLEKKHSTAVHDKRGTSAKKKVGLSRLDCFRQGLERKIIDTNGIKILQEEKVSRWKTAT